MGGLMGIHHMEIQIKSYESYVFLIWDAECYQACPPGLAATPLLNALPCRVLFTCPKRHQNECSALLYAMFYWTIPWDVDRLVQLKVNFCPKNRLHFGKRRWKARNTKAHRFTNSIETQVASTKLGGNKMRDGLPNSDVMLPNFR